MQRWKIMKKVAVVLIALILLLSNAAAQETKDKILIGFTMSQTGKFNSESKEQVQGLKLWVRDVNAKGGIYVKSLGKKLPVEIKYYGSVTIMLINYGNVSRV